VSTQSVGFSRNEFSTQRLAKPPLQHQNTSSTGNAHMNHAI